MKNVLKAFGVIAFFAIIGFSMVACGDGGDGGGGGGLAGTTWTYTESGGSATLTFNASTVRFEGFGLTENGTYTFNGSTGTITWSDGDRDYFVVNGNTLTSGGLHVRILNNKKDVKWKDGTGRNKI